MSARRLGFRGRLAALAAASAGFVSEPAAGSDFALIWQAPAECPSGDAVKKQVLKRLGSRRTAPELEVQATIERDPSGFRVMLNTYRNGRRGVRELQAPTCGALVEALAVIVAMAVDPEQRDDAAEGEPKRRPGADEPAPRKPGARAAGANSAPDGEAASSREGTEARAVPAASGDEAELASPDPAPPEARADAASAAEDRPAASDEDEADPGARAFTDLGLQGVASVAGSVEAGVLPGLGFGITARGGARLRRFRGEASVSRWFSREALSSQPGRGADVHGMSLAAWGCFRAVPAHTAAVPRLRAALPPDDSPAIEAGPCLGAEVGQIIARSFGVSEPADGRSAYVAAGGALRLGATAADWLSLDVRFEAFRILHRPDFRVENLGVVYEPSPWSLRAALGVEAYFP